MLSRILTHASKFESVNDLISQKHMLDLDRVMILPFMGTCFPASCTSDDVQTVLTTFYDNMTCGVLNQVTLGCITDDKPSFKIGHYVMMSVNN